MHVRRLFSALFAVLVTAGLMIAPLVTPAAALDLSAIVKVDQADMSAMAADMPCCPDKQKSDGCRDCPLIAMCMLKVLQAGSSIVASLAQPVLREKLRPLDDLVADGLVRPPPDQPPRFLA
ncbi:MAG: hypothetical protein AB1586_28010 [Pseudomonadota bacterium]|jgi:hypothetical protein